jgi:hypothetical protein
MLKNDKKSLFISNFWQLLRVFWWLHSCQYRSRGCSFCFTHADNHHKPHYKLLIPYVHLILTLCIVKNAKNHFFSMFEVLVHDSISTRLMKRWGCVLWKDSSPILYPWLPRRNQSMCYLRTQDGDLLRPILTARDRMLYYGLGLLSSWRYPDLQVEGMAAQKFFSPLSYIRDNVVSHIRW